MTPRHNSHAAAIKANYRRSINVTDVAQPGHDTVASDLASRCQHGHADHTEYGAGGSFGEVGPAAENVREVALNRIKHAGTVHCFRRSSLTAPTWYEPQRAGLRPLTLPPPRLPDPSGTRRKADTRRTLVPMAIGVAEPFTGRLGQALEGGLRGLDISRQEYAMVVRRYEGFAEALDATWSATYGENRVFPQGSFSLGTVVRSVKHDNNLDIDSVAVRGIAKSSISQQQLKSEVGDAAHTFAASERREPPSVRQDTRCWTVTWPTMHMDVLPAVPDPECDRGGVLITDRDVREWVKSNPAGYKEWFIGVMRDEYEQNARLEAKELDVEDVPHWLVRTTLQRTVQALKRHRDVYFKTSTLKPPSSVIITTLAALSYRGVGDLNSVLRGVTREMASHLTRAGGTWVLLNPANRDENFAEYWNDADADTFFKWHENVQQTFSGFETKAGLHASISEMERAFEWSFSDAANNLGRSLFQTRTAGALQAENIGRLSVVTGAAAGAVVRPHTFAGGYGS